jgi:hypothetical protein
MTNEGSPDTATGFGLQRLVQRETEMANDFNLDRTLSMSRNSDKENQTECS